MRMTIQVFSDINASHAATGYPGRTDLPSFHIFTVEDTYPHTRAVMPPYRFEFYQIVLLENSADASLEMNSQPLGDLSDTLLFASPEHVLAWVRGQAQRGFILYFKPEFLAQLPHHIPDEFPYFRLNELNVISVTDADKQGLRDHFTRLLDCFTSQHTYRVPMLAALLLTLLYDCRRLHDQQGQTLQQASPQYALTLRFQHFVNQHYLTRKRVSEYADLLAVSPDYLGQAVRAATHRTPLDFIAERVLLEAKKLLRYTDLNISQVAAYLGYDEPTHFGRFFRRHTGQTPLDWRQSQP